MTDEELSISDATLIARLRDWPYQGETMAGEAADRIEQLVATNEVLVKERAEMEAEAHAHTKLWGVALREKAQEKAAAEARVERLEALLREARTDLEDYVTQEYPKHAHPYFERQWNRDMELCRRIDAALKGN